jgi:hypothetical protein
MKNKRKQSQIETAKTRNKPLDGVASLSDGRDGLNDEESQDAHRDEDEDNGHNHVHQSVGLDLLVEDVTGDQKQQNFGLSDEVQTVITLSQVRRVDEVNHHEQRDDDHTGRHLHVEREEAHNGGDKQLLNHFDLFKPPSVTVVTVVQET